MTLLVPKNWYAEPEPLIFLAGPIKGAPSWQEEAYDIIMSLNAGLYVASPKKITRRVAVRKENFPFQNQLDWERFYMRSAARSGTILFWLPGQKEETPGRAYARDTRGEIGRWCIEKKHDKTLGVVFGGEWNFDGFDIILRNAQADLGTVEFNQSLEETCEAAVAVAKEKASKTQDRRFLI